MLFIMLALMVQQYLELIVLLVKMEQIIIILYAVIVVGQKFINFMSIVVMMVMME